MKRNRQHIIEEESRVAFSQIIPTEWVRNDFTKDYGKDIHLEIFEDQNATGFSFIVQLKASDKAAKKSGFGIVMEISVLKYYQKMDTPVLLVFYSTAEKSFWGVWANWLLDTLSVAETQKTVTITLFAENKIDKNYFLHLQKRYDSNLPGRINLIVNANGLMATQFAKRFRNWCDSQFSDCFEYNDSRLPIFYRILFSESEGQMLIQVDENTGSRNLSLINLSDDLSFLYTPLVKLDDIHNAEMELLFYTASVFSRLAPRPVIHLLTKFLHRYNGNLKSMHSLYAIASCAYESGSLLELQLLIERSIDTGNANDFQTLNSIFQNKHDHFDRYRENLKKAIGKFSHGKVGAALCYNLANHYRYKGEPQEAFPYYFRAKSLDPDYLNRHYWWFEVGGVLFIANHFKASAFFYHKAIDLDKEGDKLPLGFALLGDAYFQQALFSEAKERYQQYLIEVASLEKLFHGYYAFKMQLCENFIVKGLDGVHLDSRKTMEFYHKAVAEGDSQLFDKSLKFHPLNIHSWLKIGLNAIEEKEYLTAYNALLAVALISETDREYWTLCLMAAHEVQDDMQIVGIFSIMLQKFGTDILDDISKTIYHSFDMESSTKLEVIEYFSSLTKVLEPKLKEATYMPPAEVSRHYVVGN